MIDWVGDEDNVITNDELEQQFGPLSDEPVNEDLDWSEQVALRS